MYKLCQFNVEKSRLQASVAEFAYEEVAKWRYEAGGADQAMRLIEQCEVENADENLALLLLRDL